MRPMVHITHSMKPICRSDIAAEKAGREMLLYNAETETIHVLNSTAQLIWDLCDGKHSAAEIAQVVRTRFSVADGYDILDDVQRTLALFASLGLLEETID